MLFDPYSDFEVPPAFSNISKDEDSDNEQPPKDNIGLFSKLPAELRNRIYREVLVTSYPRMCQRGVCHYPDRACRCVLLRARNTAQPGLLRTCKQIRQEAITIHFLENRFIVISYDFDVKEVKMFYQQTKSAFPDGFVNSPAWNTYLNPPQGMEDEGPSFEEQAKDLWKLQSGHSIDVEVVLEAWDRGSPKAWVKAFYEDKAPPYVAKGYDGGCSIYPDARDAATACFIIAARFKAQGRSWSAVESAIEVIGEVSRLPIRDAFLEVNW